MFQKIKFSNKHKIIIIQIIVLLEQNIRMISERSCDTEDRKFSLDQSNNSPFNIYISVETAILKCSIHNINFTKQMQPCCEH